MGSRADAVVIVGGGIAGASLGMALAKEGVDVTILERTAQFSDRVRGEIMHAWGVAETQQLGTDSVLLENSDARMRPLWRRYDLWSSEGVDGPMDTVVPGVEGTLNVGHPAACQALLDAAAGAGATVIREVSKVVVTDGQQPAVSWSVEGRRFEASPDLVIGADGRASTVRKQAGIELEHQGGFSCIAGLLVEGIGDIPDKFDMTVSDLDQFMLMFRQTSSRARVYLCAGLSQTRRFAGPGGPERFLAACGELTFPWAEQLAAGVPAGPCGTVVGDDTWTATPYTDGVVVIGDAAGYNDPILGQGLSVASRDARIVRDLILDGATTPDEFASYGSERNSRMERLRLVADIFAVINAEECENRLDRQRRFGRLMNADDTTVPQLLQCVLSGPETAPDHAVDHDIPDYLRTG